jgi:hypothetical protein
VHAVKVSFLSPLSVTEIPTAGGLNLWSLNKPFYAYVDSDGQKVEIIIPEGFVSDMCSVPRIPFAYLLYGGIGNRAGVVHDALYTAWKKVAVFSLIDGVKVDYEVTRAWADEVLKAALQECGVGFFARNMMYSAVRLAGWKFYKKDSLFKQLED